MTEEVFKTIKEIDYGADTPLSDADLMEMQQTNQSVKVNLGQLAAFFGKWRGGGSNDGPLNPPCETSYPSDTLGNIRTRVRKRLGFATTADGSLPPNVKDLLDTAIIEAQEDLYMRYPLFRARRWYSWKMAAGARFYYLADGQGCNKVVNLSRIEAAYISQGGQNWRELICGIDPHLYFNAGSTSDDVRKGIPIYYDVRQAIEIWPAPADDSWTLRVLGPFALLDFSEDNDASTVAPHAIYLAALADLKAHYGQSGAGLYLTKLERYISNLTAQSHLTRRYIPGTRPLTPRVRPKIEGLDT